MVTLLLIVLTLVDIGLIIALAWMQRQRTDQASILTEITAERRLLSDMRQTIEDDLTTITNRNKDTLEKVSQIATEAEQEVTTGKDALAKELENIVTQLSTKFDTPLRELAHRQAALETLFLRLETEKKLFQRMLARGEKLCRFFDERIPYEEVLSEIEDKKYADARYLLAQGMDAEKVARELNMTPSEVRLVAEISPRG